MIQLKLKTFDKELKAFQKHIRAANFPNAHNALVESADEFQILWKQNILNDASIPKGWARKYAEGVQVKSEGRRIITLFADNMFANFVENGVKSWDMKNTHTTKMGKNGPYNVIYLANKKQKSDGPITLRQLPRLVFMNIKESLGIIYSRLSSREFDIKKGGIKSPELGGHFRVISKRKSPPDSWIYPGHPKHAILNKTMQVMEAKTIKRLREGFHLDLVNLIENKK